MLSNERPSHIPVPRPLRRWPCLGRSRCLHPVEGGVMAPECPTTISALNGAGASTVALLASSSCQTALNEHQKGAFSDDAPLSHTHWLTDLPWVSQLVAGSAFAGAPVITNSLRSCGSRRMSVHLASKPRHQFRADWYLQHRRCLSKPSSSAGSTNASKRGQIIGNAGQAGAA